jgi:hypothetical protein
VGESENNEHPYDDEDIVEIYAAGSSVEADRILLLLGENDVEGHRKETSVAMIPGAGSHRHLITVLAHDKDKAVSAIKQAIADEILPDDGTWL